MRKTINITYFCKVRNTASYWLEFDDKTRKYTFNTEVQRGIKYNFLTDFLASCYLQSLMGNIGIKSGSTLNDIHIYIEIDTDPVVTQDFNAYEDKQLPLPFGTGGQVITSNGVYNPITWVNTIPGAYTITLPHSESVSFQLNPIRCDHKETYVYTGLSHTDTYCKKCEKKL